MRGCTTGLTPLPTCQGCFSKQRLSLSVPAPLSLLPPSFSTSQCPTLDQTLIPGKVSSFFLFGFLLWATYRVSSLVVNSTVSSTVKWKIWGFYSFWLFLAFRVTSWFACDLLEFLAERLLWSFSWQHGLHLLTPVLLLQSRSQSKRFHCLVIFFSINLSAGYLLQAIAAWWRRQLLADTATWAAARNVNCHLIWV